MTPLKVCSAHGCNNVFETDQGRKYCSSKCRQKAYRDRHSTVPFDGWQVKKNCRNCGKIFWTHIYAREYCSAACKQQHYRERKKLREAGLS